MLTKNVHGSGPPLRAPDTESAFPGHARPEAPAPDVLPVPEERPDGDAAAPPTQPAAIPRLGALRAEPWRVRPGEILFEAVSRFAIRAGRTAQKPETYPVWEITTEASFEGEFEAALEWLMAGFEHTNPRPILGLHPNGIVRLMAE